jgi:hypothetical protein
MPPAASARTTTTRGFQSLGIGTAAEREHLAQLARRLLGERQVALADRQDVGDLERAGLERLDVVAEAGRADDDPGVGSAAIRVSDWPVPTVSTMTRSKPAASRQSIAAQAARDRPPSSPRAENERMKAFGWAPCSPIRIRSPRTAPPLIGLDGRRPARRPGGRARARRRGGR